MMRDYYRATIRPMLARERTGHRAATELELLFDLVFVIAIALTAAGLHHAVGAAHYVDGTVKFILALFALWWPWVNFTWFASAFDNDDVTYRISTLVMMFGALLIAGGMPLYFESLDIRLVSVGYVVLRIPQIYLWWRVATENPEYCKTAMRYVVGMCILQPCWLILAFFTNIGSTLFFSLFILGVILELAVPIYANMAKRIPWHKHHVMERYGLLNIIVLGEILLSAGLGIQEMNREHHWDLSLGAIALCATIIPFSLWWLYFNEEDHLTSDKTSRVFSWSYGHFFIYASGAAIGAGFGALIESFSEHGTEGDAKWLISIAIGIYIFGLWLVRDRHIVSAKSGATMMLFAVLIALTPLLPGFQLITMTTLLVLAVVFRVNAPVNATA